MYSICFCFFYWKRENKIKPTRIIKKSASWEKKKRKRRPCQSSGQYSVDWRVLDLYTLLLSLYSTLTLLFSLLSPYTHYGHIALRFLTRLSPVFCHPVHTVLSSHTLYTLLLFFHTALNLLTLFSPFATLLALFSHPFTPWPLPTPYAPYSTHSLLSRCTPCSLLYCHPVHRSEYSHSVHPTVIIHYSHPVHSTLTLYTLLSLSLSLLSSCTPYFLYSHFVHTTLYSHPVHPTLSLSLLSPLTPYFLYSHPVHVTLSLSPHHSITLIQHKVFTTLSSSTDLIRSISHSILYAWTSYCFHYHLWPIYKYI